MRDRWIRRKKKLIELCELGWTLQEIGDRYGVCRERVRQVLERLEIKKEPRFRRSSISDDTRGKIILAFIEDGESILSLAERYKISKNYVLNILHRGGIPNLKERFPLDGDKMKLYIDSLIGIPSKKLSKKYGCNKKTIEDSIAKGEEILGEKLSELGISLG